MAAGVLSEPGGLFGPCASPCEHSDCTETRQMATSPCHVCSEPIGYGRGFYVVDRSAIRGLPPNERRKLAHASCVER